MGSNPTLSAVENPVFTGVFALDIDLIVDYLWPTLGNFRPIYLQFTCIINIIQTRSLILGGHPASWVPFTCISIGNPGQTSIIFSFIFYEYIVPSSGGFIIEIRQPSQDNHGRGG